MSKLSVIAWLGLVASLGLFAYSNYESWEVGAIADFELSNEGVTHLNFKARKDLPYDFILLVPHNLDEKDLRRIECALGETEIQKNIKHPCERKYLSLVVHWRIIDSSGVLIEHEQIAKMAGGIKNYFLVQFGSLPLKAGATYDMDIVAKQMDSALKEKKLKGVVELHPMYTEFIGFGPFWLSFIGLLASVITILKLRNRPK